MLFFLYKAMIKFCLPPGIFIVVLIALLIVRLKKYKKIQKTDITLCVFSVILYLFCTYSFSDFLMFHLEHRYPPMGLSQSLKYRKIIVLGGGISGIKHNGKMVYSPSLEALPRVMEASKLYFYAKKHHLKDTIYISGGGYEIQYNHASEAAVYRETLIAQGVEKSAIQIEDKSLTTTQNARFLKEKFGTNTLNNAILITSAFHMERAMQTFNKTGVKLHPSPVGYHRVESISPKFNGLNFLPSMDALSVSAIAINEYFGMIKTLF